MENSETTETLPETLPKRLDKPWLWRKGERHDAEEKLRRRVLQYAKARSWDAIHKLVELMEDPKSPKSIQLMASLAILDRGLGKPKQAIEVEDKSRTLEDLLREVHEARARAAKPIEGAVIVAQALPEQRDPEQAPSDINRLR